MDAAGQVHIAGETKSTDFPVTADAARPSHGGGTFDAVYARLAADGSLGYGSYIGGTDTDQAVRRGRRCGRGGVRARRHELERG